MRGGVTAIDRERALQYGAPVPGHAAGRVAATRVSFAWASTLPVWLNPCATGRAAYDGVPHCVRGYLVCGERGGGRRRCTPAAMDVRCLCERAGVEGVCVCGLWPRVSTLCRRRLRVGASAPSSAIVTTPASSG